MDWLLSFARLTLALLFAVAGATKLADLRGTRQAMVDFGVPDKLSGLCARLLPVFELILAGLLLPMETARLAALGALALLAGIEAGIAGNLALGRTPDCHCFGQLHSKPLSWSLFARNLVLLALAGLIAAYGPGTWGPNAVQSLTAGEALGLFCAAVALAAVVPLWWNLRRLEKEVEGLQELRQLVEQFEYTRIPQAERHGVAPPEEGHPVGAEAPDFLLRRPMTNIAAIKGKIPSQGQRRRETEAK